MTPNELRQTAITDAASWRRKRDMAWHGPLKLETAKKCNEGHSRKGGAPYDHDDSTK